MFRTTKRTNVLDRNLELLAQGEAAMVLYGKPVSVDEL
jgi:hypothetical protein